MQQWLTQRLPQKGQHATLANTEVPQKGQHATLANTEVKTKGPTCKFG